MNLKWLGLRGGAFRPPGPGFFCEGQDLGSTGICGSGGAIFSRGSVSIFRNAIYDNDAGDFARGGAIFSQGSLTISHTDIHDNDTGQSFAGGIWSETGPLLIEDSFIFRNSSDVAGGIFIAGEEAIIRRTTIFSNMAERDFGGGILNGGQLTIENSTIDRNVSRGDRGAGISNFGTLTLVSTTVSRNIASLSSAAGISNFGTAFILNSTISQNDSIRGGVGGLVNGGHAELQNTILAGNTRSEGTIASDCDSATSLGHNIIGDLTGCNINLQGTDLTGDPGLGEYTEDEFVAGSGHFPLLSGSPAINSANPDACPPTDQLGNVRVGVCDIGSVEFQGQGPLLTVRRDVIRAGRSIVARWRAIPAPTSTDWIGLYLPGSPNTSFIDWIYVSCSKTPGNPDRRGSCDFLIPDSLAPGTYELRLLANDGFMRLASSDGFMVRPSREGLASQAP